jgi:hypothetical protein
VVLDLQDNPSLKRLVGKTIQLPPAFMEWSADKDEQVIESIDQDFEAPKPQL